MSTQINHVIYNQKDPIAYRIKPEVKTNRTIGLPYRLSNEEVDLLLQDYRDLIDVRYTPWFAKRFYYMTVEQVQRYASEARQDGKNAQRLFSHLVRKNCA